MVEFKWYFEKMSFLRKAGKDSGMTVRGLTVIISAILLLFAGCSDTQSDPRLMRIRENVGSAPEDAIKELKEIDYKSLNTRDRHLYDLLSIKAKDKAYMRHTSDSLISDVINWYKENPEYGLYPEAL